MRPFLTRPAAPIETGEYVPAQHVNGAALLIFKLLGPFEQGRVLTSTVSDELVPGLVG